MRATSTREEQLISAIRGHSGLSTRDIEQAAEHGADAGWAGFTYTADGADFTRANRELVWEMLAEEAEEMGAENIAAYVASFNRSDMADTADGFDCLLAWWALETAGRYLADTAEERRAAELEAMGESGEKAGRAAGSWVSDGNSTEDHYRAVLKAINDCELDIPAPLSGEYADGWTAARAFEDADVEQPEDETELLDSWEEGFTTGYEAQAAEDARGFLGLDQRV